MCCYSLLETQVFKNPWEKNSLPFIKADISEDFYNGFITSYLSANHYPAPS